MQTGQNQSNGKCGFFFPDRTGGGLYFNLNPILGVFILFIYVTIIGVLLYVFRYLEKVVG